MAGTPRRLAEKLQRLLTARHLSSDRKKDRFIHTIAAFEASVSKLVEKVKKRVDFVPVLVLKKLA